MGTAHPTHQLVLFYFAIVLQIKRPDRSRFIRLYLEDTNELVHSIDVTSPDVIFPEQCVDCNGRNRTLTFNIDFSFLPGESYYILIDGGM